MKPTHTMTPVLVSIYASLLVLVVAPVFAVATASAATEVTSCGQVVEEDGFLTADLDCSGTSGLSVVFTGNKVGFDLGGFTLTGGDLSAVACTRRCRVENGTVTGAGENGVLGIRGLAGKLEVSNLVVSDNGLCGVAGNKSAVVVDSVISGNGRCGVSGGGRTQVINSAITANGWPGVGGRKGVRISGSTISGNQWGVSLSSGQSGHARIVDSSIVGNLYGGFFGIRLRAKNTTFANNVADPADPCVVDEGVQTACRDIISMLRPVLRNSACETSLSDKLRPRIGRSWGICSLD